MKRYRPKAWTVDSAFTYAKVQALWNPEGAARLVRWAIRRYALG